MILACTVDPGQCRSPQNPPNHLPFELDLDAKGFTFLQERQLEVHKVNDFSSNECHEA